MKEGLRVTIESSGELTVYQRGHKLLGFYGWKPNEELLKKFDEKLDPKFEICPECPQCRSGVTKDKKTGTFFKGLEMVVMVSSGKCSVCKKITSIRTGMSKQTFTWVSGMKTTDEARHEGIERQLQDNIAFEIMRITADPDDDVIRRPDGGRSGYSLN